jgi:hypothetical protein
VVAILLVERGEHHYIGNLLDKHHLQVSFSTVLVVFLGDMSTLHADVDDGLGLLDCAVFVRVFDVRELVFVGFEVLEPVLADLHCLCRTSFMSSRMYVPNLALIAGVDC